MTGAQSGRESGGWRVEERTADAGTLHASWPAVEDDPGHRAVAVCRVTSPAVVLGSAQSPGVLDPDRIAGSGVMVTRRRSGGGAVMVTPADPVWVYVWVPSGDQLWRDDVGRAFDWLGGAWVAALARVGIDDVSAHDGGYLSCTRWARTVCFGGVGTGEVVAGDGRKVVGLSQRRTRAGAWFHGACYLEWDPSGLVGLLDLSSRDRAAAVADLTVAAVGVRDLVPGSGGIDADRMASALVAALRHLDRF